MTPTEFLESHSGTSTELFTVPNTAAPPTHAANSPSSLGPDLLHAPLQHALRSAFP